MSPPPQPPPQPPSQPRQPPDPPDPPQTRQQKKNASPNKQRKKRNQPYPPSRELIQRQAKKDATARGFNKRRGTSTSPRNLRRHLDDTTIDEADDSDGEHVSISDADVANPPVAADNAEDDVDDGDAPMAEANLGDLTGDASNIEFDHAYSDSADPTNITMTDAERETHQQGEEVLGGDSKVQVVIGSTSAGHDDDSENAGVICADQKDDNAVVGDEAEFDALDMGAISDLDIMSVSSSSVASVEHLKTVPTSANANLEDDDSLFEMGGHYIPASSAT
eukprot:scaffold2852_cov54-Cyclotella_meneghiniana.AAC.8